MLPDNLTRTDSILRGLADDIPEEDWEQVRLSAGCISSISRKERCRDWQSGGRAKIFLPPPSCFYAKLDCAVSGTELRWLPVVADLPGLAAERQNGVLH